MTRLVSDAITEARQMLQDVAGVRYADAALIGFINDAVLDAQHNTRNYAKRQITWFRREPGLEWLHGFGDDPHVRARALARVDAFLTNAEE